ncbi:MAG: hypothetical protein CMA03_04340 [Euryarchaeota archaeon]|nr:hypothetical protein [Euryarchaeota archaeon]
MFENIGRKHLISVVILVAVIVAFPQINKLWLESTEEVRSSLITSENNTHYGLPSEWENTQVICIHFPIEDVTSNMTASNFTEDITYFDASGSEILINEDSEALVNYSEGRDSGVCVGGFDNYTAGFNFMLEATNVTNGEIEIGYDDSDWGPYIHTIAGLNANDLTGNFSGAYWALYHNGVTSDVGIGDLVMLENSVIVWEIATW